jgi:hypothetical protein
VIDNVKALRLSARAWEILLIIDERSRDGRMWVPREKWTDDQFCERTGRWISICGGSDARIIKSLWAKGLATPYINLGPYASRITEYGRMAIERGLEQNAIPLDLTAYRRDEGYNQ